VAILGGQLPPGARLPSWNSLASQLGVARGTVKAAYDRLAGEGYVLGRGPSGTVVNPELHPVAPAQAPPPDPGTEVSILYHRGAPPLPFQPGLPALDAFPRKLWSRLVAQHAARLRPADMTYPDPAGWPALREAVAGYLAVARGIACSPGEVFITAGFTGALALVTRALLHEGDRVWCEDPGYPPAREALLLAGAAVVPVPVDDEGIDVARGIALAPDARLAVVTPSCQAPLGVKLSLQRRLALLAWAARAGAWILEDDYTGEFRLDGPAAPALKGLDADAGRVIYAGTFSKVLLPSLRLGYVVAPRHAVPHLRRIASYLLPSTSLETQRVVAALVSEGHLGRHIRRTRALYAQRRAALLAALEASCGKWLRIGRGAEGMHLLARLPPDVDDVALARHAVGAGLAPGPLSPWAVEAGFGPGLVIAFSNVPADAAPRQARRLADVLREQLG